MHEIYRQYLAIEVFPMMLSTKVEVFSDFCIINLLGDERISWHTQESVTIMQSL